jgi:arginyl-tRNA synthetase
MDFKKELSKLCAKELGISEEKIESFLTKPPEGLGDFTIPCFAIAKELKKNPMEVAKTLSEIKAPFLEKAETKGPYVNFFISKSFFSEAVLSSIISLKQKPSNKKSVLLEYSSPNTNKPLHVGHLRNNFLGMCFSKLLEFDGYAVKKANLINDRGVHICKSMLAYQMFAEKENKTPETEKMKGDHFVGSMYVKFSEEAKKNPTLEQKALDLLKLWEAGDEKTLAVWKKMNEWTLEGMKQTYANFGTLFDVWLFESDTFKLNSVKKIIEEGKEKKIFVEKDGALTAILEPELPNKVIMRTDGTSLYVTNDLALTEYKFDTFHPDKNIWLTANEQDLYFQQLIKIFEKLGRTWAAKCQHKSYGYITLPSGRMKSREGTVVDADDLLRDSIEKALVEIEKRHPELSVAEKSSRAKKIAVTAIKFSLLKFDAKKDVIFEVEKAVSFEGQTGPYLQYSYARAKSILRKAPSFSREGFELLGSPSEKALLEALESFSVSVARSVDELTPHHIAQNALLIADRFNSFYHDSPVINPENPKQQNARLTLVEAVTKALKDAFCLLDLDLLEEM